MSYRSGGMILTNNHVVSGATHVDVAFLGLQPGVLTPQIAGQLGVTENGVAVYTVTADGPADRASIRPGDVLTTVAGQKIATVEEPFAALRQHEPGETVSISHVRGDKQRTAQVQVTDRPSWLHHRCDH